MHIQPLDQLIPTLEPYFTTKAPVQIPTGGREFIVKIAPWLVIIFAVLGALSIVGLFGILALGSAIIGLAAAATVSQGGLWVITAWISLALLVISVVLEFMAFPGLKNFNEQGWKYIYYTQVIGLVSSVIGFLGNYTVNSLVFSLLSTLIGLYILFQVRDYYTGKAKLSANPASPDTK